jgi:hypothetical protein
MNELRRQLNETCADWLRRLERIEAEALPRHQQRALALSIGYARYLMGKGNQDRNAPMPALSPSASSFPN